MNRSQVRLPVVEAQEGSGGISCIASSEEFYHAVYPDCPRLFHEKLADITYINGDAHRNIYTLILFIARHYSQVAGLETLSWLAGQVPSAPHNF